MTGIGTINDWHAHVYYDLDGSKEKAAEVREQLAAQFPDAVIGKWHNEPVGPHLDPMYQVKFDWPLFPEIVPWLSLNRQGLNVLVHPRTGDSAPDHTARAIWMGERLAVKYDLDDGAPSAEE